MSNTILFIIYIVIILKNICQFSKSIIICQPFHVLINFAQEQEFRFFNNCICMSIFVFLLSNRSDSYNGGSNFMSILTPLTFLVSYTNSAINPLLYAFLSRNFRKGMRELLLCSFKKTKSEPIKQRLPINVSIEIHF